jgi:hypothetical protein
MTSNRTRSGGDPLDRLLEACDPVHLPALSGAEVEDALEELGAVLLDALPARSQPAPRRLIGRPRTTLLAATAVLVTAGAVTAGTVMTAHTGHFPTKAEEKMGGPGEGLNPAAADFPDVALEAVADIPYPSGYESWREFVLAEQMPSAADEGEPMEVSTGALRGWFAASAYCAWIHAWRKADIAGNAADTGHAAEVIGKAPGWEAVVAEDPHPDPDAANDPGAESGTIFGWMLPYRDAVLAGDRNRVDQLLAAGYGDGKCWLSDPAWRAEEDAHRDAWATLSRKELAQKYKEYLARAGS